MGTNWPLQRSPITLPQFLQPLRFRDLCFHLRDQHPELLLALFAGVCVDIAGVLFTIGPLGRVAAFKQVVVDLAMPTRAMSSVPLTFWLCS